MVSHYQTFNQLFLNYFCSNSKHVENQHIPRKIFFVALYMIKVYICTVKIYIHESKASPAGKDLSGCFVYRIFALR